MNIDSESLRKTLLLSLKENARKLTPYLHEASNGAVFSEKNSHAEVLCSNIEKCIFHGIKSEEFCGVMPFWGLLERLETTTPPLVEVRNSVGAVACMSALRTPTGRARAWIRQSLNTCTLEVTIVALTKYHQRLLDFFYEENALLNVPGDVAVLVFKFNFTVDETSLNYSPDWLAQQLLDQQQRDRPRTVRRRSIGAPPGDAAATAPPSARPSGGTLFGMGDLNLFSTLEKGLDSVINHTVKYLNDAFDGDEALSQLTSPLPMHPFADSPTGRRRTPLFGSSLKALVRDESRCAVAKLDSRIGIPDSIMLLATTISEEASTEGLFRQRGPPAEAYRLRASLESEAGIPPQTSIHTITHCFLQWLYELPEPLFGFDVYDAVQSCQDIESEEHRNRNLTLLMEEVPWYCQPTLALVMKLLHTISRPELAAQNRLNIVAISVFATPFLMRPRSIPRLSGAHMTPEEIDRAHLTAAAAGGAVVGILVENMPDTFDLLQRSQQARVASLTNKCDRLHVIQWEAIRPIVIQAVEKGENIAFPDEEGTAASEKACISDDVDDEATLSRIFGADCVYSDFTERREDMIYNMLALLWIELRRTHHRLTTADSVQGADDSDLVCPDIDDVQLEGESMVAHTPPQSPSGTSSSPPEMRRAASFSESHLFAYYVPATRSSTDRTRTNSLGLTDDGSLPASPSRLQRLMKSARWGVCFPSENPMKDFNAQLTGLLAVKCLTYFLKKFGDKASLIVCEFARKRKKLAPLPMVCCYLVQICLVCLKLVHPHSFSYSAAYERNRRAVGGFPTEEGDGGIPLREVARECTWKLLSDDTCLEELFCVSLMTFDDLWKHLLSSCSPTPSALASATAGICDPPESPRKSMANSALAREVLASCMTGCRVLLDELLAVRSVVSVEQMWRAWLEQRLQRQQAVVEAQFKRRSEIQTKVVQKQPSFEPSPGSLSGDNKYISHHRPAAAMPMKGPIGGGTPTSKGAKVDPVPATTAVDRKAAAGVEESFTYDSLPGIEKTCLGISSRVYGEKEVMILNKTEIQMLEDALPIDMQCCDWDLTYSLLRDGASLETLLRSSGSSQRTILVIEDAKGRKFGGIICDDAWRMSGEHYYGSGTCQVFTFRPIGSGETYGTTLEVYPATMKNEYYMLLSTDCIGLGGGGGGFAVMLDGDLQYGCSYDNCETFDSPCLASSNEFECYRCNLYVVHRV